MPKLLEHDNIGKMTGAVASAAYGLFVEEDKWNTVFYALGGLAGGWFCSRIPDFLEPSKELGPNHRGVCHGIAGNAAIGFAGYEKVKEILNYHSEEAKKLDAQGKVWQAVLHRMAAGFIAGGIAGYGSHLLADAKTSASLPLLGLK